ncbi:GntR family transcriptional regulator [Phytohabitans houttuyneae]|uniref:GntR family transcriptional regulator n=1 Tax=Phytohabitans houttuyneae TaxID=1076126 RepID=A0A6V8K3J9_9ACTN|nr:GntR family transcriptional regulator [Phytohabitans houttuyneae]GFJ78314.1 GntR family transcriptional regulator [Phytohabitans houttuyneae]
MVTPPMKTQLQTLPLWRQVADRLREQILSGAYPAGQPLPPERRLADEYGVSVTVIRQAVKTLVTEGLVTVRRPYGTVVRDPHARPSAEPRGLSIVDGTVTEPGADQWAMIDGPTFTRADASAWHADVFGIAAAEPMLTRDTLHHRADGARRSVRLIMPFRVAADLTTPWLDDPHLPPATDVYTWLHDNGHRLSFTEQVRARMPVGDETSALRMRPETPLLTITRTASTGGRALTVEEIRVPADQTEPAYPLPVSTPRRTNRAAGTTRQDKASTTG